ncbi:hypothetical protein YC2023_018435 [Brassica napus]
MNEKCIGESTGEVGTGYDHNYVLDCPYQEKDGLKHATKLKDGASETSEEGYVRRDRVHRDVVEQTRVEKGYTVEIKGFFGGRRLVIIVRRGSVGEGSEIGEHECNDRNPIVEENELHHHHHLHLLYSFTITPLSSSLGFDGNKRKNTINVTNQIASHHRRHVLHRSPPHPS